MYFAELELGGSNLKPRVNEYNLSTASKLNFHILIFQWFRDEVSKEEDMPDELLALLFAHIDPIYELHCQFLKDIEQRMAAW